MSQSLFDEFKKTDELSADQRALMLAARQNDPAALAELIASGVSLAATDPGSGRSPVGEAVYFHAHAAIEALLAAGADPEARDANGRSPLCEAARGHCEACMKSLLAGGANPEAEEDNGYFPLLFAAEQALPRHSFAGLSVLLEGGANASHQSALGYFALASAACDGRVADIELLLAKGARVNMVDESGFSALHFAIQFEHAPAVAKLLAAGADITLRAQRRGQSLDALAYAESTGNAEISGMIYAFKELLDLRSDFPSLGQFIKSPGSHHAL